MPSASGVLRVGPVDPAAEVELAPLTTLGVGGRARYLVEARDEATLFSALEWAHKRGLGVYLLGGGSNLVVSDLGVDGLVIRMRLSGVDAEEGPGRILVHASSGEVWDELVALTVGRGWAGLECMSGIPGQVGAVPIQNVGAYGQEVAERIHGVAVLDRATGRRVELAPATCRLGYRDSLFKSREPGRYVVLGVTFALTPGGPATVRYPELERALGDDAPSRTLAEVRTAVLALRRKKSMLWDPADEDSRSCGSFFVNPILDHGALLEVERRVGSDSMPRHPQPDGRTKLSAAWLIEQAGFRRGTRDGTVGLSEHHALALVCHAGATAGSVVRFAHRIRAAVLERSGVLLRPEPVFWGFGDLEEGLPRL
jgi:UDP-N-acetylmuramate dehydrogenase